MEQLTGGASELRAEPKRPGIWSGLGTVVLYFALQFGVGLLFGSAAGVVLAVKAGLAARVTHTVAPSTGTLLASLQTNPNVQAWAAITTVLGAAILIALLIRQFWPRQWTVADPPGFGFAKPSVRYAYVLAIGLTLVALTVGGLLTHVLAGKNPIPQNVTVIARDAPLALRIVLAVVAVCIAPAIEELLFRGVLLSGFARRIPVNWAIVACAIAFGCAHLPDFKFAWYGVPTLILLGLVFGWLRVRTRSLWPAIVAHATNNLVATVAWFVAVHH